jgi:hypothetical protein
VTAMSATVDLDQLAALRALRRGSGDVQVLKVVDHQPGRDPAPVQGHAGASAVTAGSPAHAGRPISAPGWGAEVNRR